MIATVGFDASLQKLVEAGGRIGHTRWGLSYMSCIPYAFTELSKRELTIVVSLSPYEKLLQQLMNIQ